MVGADRPARDHLWLTEADWKGLVPAEPQVGKTLAVPRAVAERLARYHLIDNTRGEPPMWQKDQVRSCDLTLTVKEVTARAVALRLTGAVVLATEADPAKAKRGFDVRLLSYVRYDRAKKTIERLNLVALGDHWGSGRGAERTPLGIVFELRAEMRRPTVSLPRGLATSMIICRAANEASRPIRTCKGDHSMIALPLRTGWLIAACIAVFLSVGTLQAGNWPSWRGPNGDGHSDEKDLPLTWGGKANENILWRIKLDGRSYSSPIVWGDRVFVTTAPKQSDADVKNKVIPEHFVTCYQASDGKQLWQTSVPHGPFADGYYTIPTPVTDGKLVYAWFGSGLLAAVDFDGKIVWRRERAGPYRVYPGVSSSPLLYGDSVLVLCDQGKDSFLMAVDRKTGEVKWEQKRPTMSGTNSTPVLMRVKDKPQMVVASGRALQGIDPASGKVLWWCGKDGGYWTSFTCGSGLVYTDSGGGRGLAVDPCGEGDVNKTHIKWQMPKVPEGLACPLIVGDCVYRVHKPGILKCWKLSTGELLFDERLPGVSFLASPIATADGRIYLASGNKGYVLKAGPKLEILATNTIQSGGDDGPSAALSGGRLFLKSSNQLICVGKK